MSAGNRGSLGAGGGGGALSRLAAWYAARCDGKWEQQRGVVIETIDNPGWLVTINLDGTPLAKKEFEPITVGEPASTVGEWKRNGPWMECGVNVMEDGSRVFEMACDPEGLERGVGVFLEWAEERH